MLRSIQFKLLKKLLSKEEEEGFSLIELVVVVSVLAVLAAIALPSFNCVQRRAQATAALASLRQIQTECAVEKAEDGMTGTFMASNLEGYEIQSDGSNSCNGSEGTGLITAMPDDTTTLPTFILATNSSELTYSFKGESGTDFSQCLGMICFSGDNSLAAKYNQYDFVVPNAMVNNNCSDYIIVEGSTWEEAEANANQMGGNLITINDQDEYIWLQQNLWKDDKLLIESGANRGDSDSTYYFVGLNDADEEGNYVWSSGQESEWANNEDLIHRQNWLAQQHHAAYHDYFVVGSNDVGFTDYEQKHRPELYNGSGGGQLAWIDNESSMYQGAWNQPHYGIAEVTSCDNK